MKHFFTITKWCKSITDSGKDEYTGRKPKLIARWQKANNTDEIPKLYKFRLLDDDGIIYAYGLNTRPNSFAPLDYYENAYGCTEIQYRDEDTTKWETL